MKTLILTRHDVEKILSPSVANETVEKAFRAYSLGCTQMPPKSYLYFPKGDLRSMPAYISGEGFDIAGIKCVNVHPQNAASYSLTQNDDFPILPVKTKSCQIDEIFNHSLSVR